MKGHKALEKQVNSEMQEVLDEMTGVREKYLLCDFKFSNTISSYKNELTQ